MRDDNVQAVRHPEVAEPGDVGAHGETTPPAPPYRVAVPRPHASEAGEREAALQRGRARRLQFGDEAASGPHRHSLWDTNPAFAALAENVRDYAIFLMNPEGEITFWGEGARLLKWWSREEAEGAHLRLLYPENGGEDGTAEDHLHQAEIQGEYSGEGQRVRRDGSTFWAGVTLTALRRPDGELIGFSKTTRDLAARRANEATIATAHAAHTARDVAVSQAERAQTARAHAEEDAEFSREQASGAKVYLRQVIESEIAGDKARREKDEGRG